MNYQERLEYNRKWLAKKKVEDPAWWEHRKAYTAAYQKTRRERLMEDPDWAENERARQRECKRKERLDPRRWTRRKRVSQAWRKRKKEENPKPFRLRDRRTHYSRYGITIKDYNEMHDKQSGLCAICGEEETKTLRGKVLSLAIDHCHKTKKVRGLLCFRCNVGIGQFRDDPTLIRNALEYLKGDSHGKK